ncbi:MAG: hypothetical protein RLZZ605_761 [Bacteroidota bacterium]
MEERIIVKLEAEIGDLKNQLNAAQGELKRFGIGVEQSIGAISLNSLNAQLGQLQKQLGTVDVGSQAFKNIGNEIAIVEGKVNSALTSIGQSAGRSKTGFNGLNNSINQLTRELPAFGLSANIGFLAISNNLPILFDEINKVRSANKALAAEGLVTTSVFKSLSAALFSWQTALSVGVTLLTVYGGKIIDLLSNLGKVEEGFNAAKEQLKGLDDVFKSQSLGNTIGQVILLKSSIETAGKSIQGQKQFVDEYNKTIGTVTGNVKSFSEAEAGIVGGTEAYINAMVQRAIAIKFADQAGQVLLEKEEIRAKQAIRIKENSNSYLLKAEQDYANNTNPEETKISGLEFYGQKREKYIKQSIEWQIAQQIEADKREIASVDKKFKTFEQLSKEYYKKSGLIKTTPEPPAPTERGIPEMAKMMDSSDQIAEAKKLFDFFKQQGPQSFALLGEAYVNNPFFKKLMDGEIAKKTLEIRTDIDKLGKSPTWISPEMLQFIHNIETISSLISNTLSSAFESALVSGDNFFKVMWRGLTNLIYKLAAAAAAALILTVLLAPWKGGEALAAAGGFEGIFAKLTGFKIGAGSTKSVYMPSNSTGQGNYQIDIMGDKMRLLLDNTAIKNTRVI